MTDHKSDDTSESEEMYLLTIARMAGRSGSDPVPIAHIAEKLGLQPVSVHQMIRKLEENGLVTYYPYKGVLLTEMGEDIAYNLLRFHRLWEVFLASHLGFSIEEASEIACDLEHASTEELASRLESYLEHSPGVHGEHKKIQDYSDQTGSPPLFSLGVGCSGTVTHVDKADPAGGFLFSEGIRQGIEVSVLGKGSRGDMLIEVNGRSIQLGETIASRIQVKPSLQSPETSGKKAVH